MDFKFNKHIKLCLKLILPGLFCLVLLHGYAQKKEKVYLSMEYKQLVNEYRLIEVNVLKKVEGKFYPIPGLPIQIFMDTEDDKKLLATLLSNENGMAKLAVEKDYTFYKNEKGYYTLHANFEGSKEYKKASKKKKSKDLLIKANFIEKDSLNYIYLNAFEIIKDSLIPPEGDLDFKISVKRIFANLEILKGVFKHGEAKIEFPGNIPGNEEGAIDILVVVDEKEYNRVELIETKNWGTRLIIEKPKNKNATAISYVVFMIVSAVVIAFLGLLLSKFTTKS